MSRCSRRDFSGGSSLVWRGSRPLLLVLVLSAVLAACGSSHGTPAASASNRHSGEHNRAHARRWSGQLSGLKLWVNPDSSAALQEAEWRRTGRSADAGLIARIAKQPTAVWLAGGQAQAASVAATVAAAQRAHEVAQFVLYNIPDRDCGQYSSGGASNASAYLRWVRGIVRGFGDHRVIVILEPDAIDQAASGCLGSGGAGVRYGMLAGASRLLRQDPKAYVYLDAGDAGWLTPAQIVGPLRQSGIAEDAGFSVNVANFYTDAQSVAFGRRLSALLGGKHFVIDTSRNGNGAPHADPGVNQWCNPPGRALGHAPTTDTGIAPVDAFLWVKYPGQSDGTCRPGQPPAGAWWPAYALDLVRDSVR